MHTSYVPDIDWDKNHFERLIARREVSPHLEQRKSILVGIDPIRGTSVSLPRDAIDSGHVHTSGRTGVGKTQTSLLALILQLIRGYRHDDGRWSKKAPVIVLDLKGDYALFHAVKRAAERDGRLFKFLSTQPQAGYYFFDPFQCFSLNHASVIDLASDWVRSLGLDNGIVYAGKYFTDQNVVLLKDAIRDMRLALGHPTLGKLTDKLTTLASQPGKKDAVHIKLCVDMLAEYPQLNEDLHVAKPYPRIDVTESIRRGDVLYFFLPCLRGGSSVRQIAALVLSTIVQAAEWFRAHTNDTGPFYAIIDEFYHIAGKAFGDLLAMTRDWDLHFILANQTHSQLKAHDPDLPPVIRTNTNVEQMFSAEDIEEIRFLQEGSGQAPMLNMSLTLGDRTNSVGYSAKDEWVGDWNTIQRVNDTKNHYFLKVNDGMPWEPGKRLRIVQALYPLSQLEYGQFRLTPLPSTPAHELKAAQSRSDSAQASTEASKAYSERDYRFSAREQSLQDRLAAKFAELTALDGPSISA